MTTRKNTKLDTLNADLVKARAALVAAKSRLQPRIDAEQARVDGLRRTCEQTNKAKTKAYEAYQGARDKAAKQLPDATRLEEAIRDHIGEQYPEADIEVLAAEYRGARIAADADVIAAKAQFETASARDKKAYGAWNVASHPGGDLGKLRHELEKYEDAVRKLEKEIERLPRYRQAAKDRRDEERRENEVYEQTEAARALMANFLFE